MDDKMRTTKHSGRVHRDGSPYDPKHNDRDYEDDKNDPKEDRSKNMYWNMVSENWYPEEEKSEHPTFVSVEKLYYEKNFRNQYEKTMENYRKNGHSERVKPFEEWRSVKQRVPEEVYFQIGDMENHVEPGVFMDVFDDYLEWELKWCENHGNPFQILNMAYHGGEAVPQIHLRRVWQSEDENGDLQIGQEKALEKAGVELPYPNRKPSRYNNRKMTYDTMCRNKWLEMCKKRGVSIETVPLPGAKHNMNKEQAVYEKWKKRERDLKRREKAVEAQEAFLSEKDKELQEREERCLKKENKARRSLLQNKAREQELEKKQKNLDLLEKQLQEREQEIINRINNVTKREYAEDRREQENIVAIQQFRKSRRFNFDKTSESDIDYQY